MWVISLQLLRELTSNILVINSLSHSPQTCLCSVALSSVIYLIFSFTYCFSRTLWVLFFILKAHKPCVEALGFIFSKRVYFKGILKYKMGVGGTLEYFSDLMSSGHKHKKKKQLQTVELKVRMDCDGCELKVKKALSSLSGKFHLSHNLFFVWCYK